ncbi:MAG: gliding motility-associated C-terminal domain-containing protein, partial [Bacteroidales bacterium]|nr:gliding motility-associated C-terminal domain-containing protein [Bacteroidales bacterium]
VANAGAGGNECDLNFRFSAVPSIGTGLWTLTSGPGTAVFTPNAATYNATVTVSAYGTYVFTWTETNNNCTSSAPVTVNFYQQPVANAGTGGNNCGPDFNLKAVPSVGTGTWTRVSGPGTATFSPNANSPTAKVTVSAYGTYVFRWTEVNGTCTSSSTVSVTFIQQPSADAGNGGDECDKDFQLNAKPNGGTGTWSKISGPGDVTFTPNASTYNAKVTVTQFGEYDFAWTETNSTCTSSDIIRVTFHDKPAISAGEDVPACEQGSVQLRATGEGTGGTYLWSPANLLNNPNIANPIASPLVTTVFTVTYTDQFGCSNSDRVTVEVRKRPVAKAGPDQTLDYIFETDMEAVLDYAYEIGKWTVLEGTGELENENSPTTHVSNLSLGRNRILWTVTNDACPAVNDTVNIIVNNLAIPTLITPNLDGKNDFFVIRGIETLGKCELVIFNRWGAEVYKNSDYDNSWDGKDDKGNDLPPETYFFIFKPEKSRALSGYIVIRR